MRIVVVGLGVQGNKRRAVAGPDVVAVADPVHPEADVRNVRDISPADYDAALVCTPDDVKLDVLTHLLGNGKHVLVEKPLLAAEDSVLAELQRIARDNGALCYTAYNHRFEPHFVRMRDMLASGELGRIYSARLFYGNGTARLVQGSPWRDRGAGVLSDLGSHLLDTLLFWFGSIPEVENFELWSANRFENCAFDHMSFGAPAQERLPLLQMEITLLSWRNHFYADVYAEKGSAHISSLCKWGPSSFVVRRRQLPSGRPDEEAVTLVQPDPTWEHEYRYFKECVESGKTVDATNIANDIRINGILRGLAGSAGVGKLSATTIGNETA